MPRIVRALAPRMHRAIHALVLHVPHVPRELRALVLHVSRALRALVPHVLCASRTSCPMWPHALRPFGLFFLTNPIVSYLVYSMS